MSLQQNILACSTNTYHNFNLEEALRGISSAGFRYVEIAAVSGWTQHITPDTSPELLKKLLAQNNLEFISISAHSNFSQDEGKNYFMRCLSFAKQIGVNIVNTGLGESKNKEEIKRTYANIKTAANYAHELNLTIAIETHGDIIPTGSKAREVLKEINSPNVKINYDTGNVLFYGDVKPEDDLPLIVDQVAHIHLKDKIGEYKEWNFPALGEGKVNFPAIFEILRKASYNGPLSLEIEFTPSSNKSLKQINEATQKSFLYLKKIL